MQGKDTGTDTIVLLKVLLAVSDDDNAVFCSLELEWLVAIILLLMVVPEEVRATDDLAVVLR